MDDFIYKIVIEERLAFLGIDSNILLGNHFRKWIFRWYIVYCMEGLDDKRLANLLHSSSQEG